MLLQEQEKTLPQSFVDRADDSSPGHTRFDCKHCVTARTQQDRQASAQDGGEDTLEKTGNTNREARGREKMCESFRNGCDLDADAGGRPLLPRLLFTNLAGETLFDTDEDATLPPCDTLGDAKRLFAEHLEKVTSIYGAHARPGGPFADILSYTDADEWCFGIKGICFEGQSPKLNEVLRLRIEEVKFLRPLELVIGLNRADRRREAGSVSFLDVVVQREHRGWSRGSTKSWEMFKHSQNDTSRDLPTAQPPEGERSVRLRYKTRRDGFGLFKRALDETWSDLRESAEKIRFLGKQLKGTPTLQALTMLRELMHCGAQDEGESSSVIFQLESSREQQRFLALLDSWKRVDWCQVVHRQRFRPPVGRVSWHPQVRKEVRQHFLSKFETSDEIRVRIPEGEMRDAYDKWDAFYVSHFLFDALEFHLPNIPPGVVVEDASLLTDLIDPDEPTKLEIMAIAPPFPRPPKSKSEEEVEVVTN
ncbi:unnamed protein product [Amoebophrya sp. A25]|nr:unnamed protein product [Amoebophrya sp. A25]|eukprot:GSA25T00000975001.1